MEINYANNKLQKELTDDKELCKNYGTLAKKIKQRLTELASAENLAVISPLRPQRCHELKGDKKGQLTVDINENWRLFFIPDHNPIPTKDDGGLNWEEVTHITIISVDDPH